MQKKGLYEKYLKRTLDAAAGVAALAVLSPVMLVTAAAVRVKLGSPVIFHQDRPGKDEKSFRLYKFRTMTDERDSNGELLPDEQRLTSFGKFLRSASLDELPGLWCIVTGKMSFVGPRPLLTKYLPLYNERQHRRHEVRPGLTGYAQANGRNALSWEEKFEYDVYYVDNISLPLDIKIMCKTAYHVLKRDGINAEGSATMEEFKGTGVELGV